MRQWLVTSALAVAVVGGVAACGSTKNNSSGVTTTTLVATGAGKQFAFCGFWDMLDKQTADATSPAQALRITASNPGLIADLVGSIPTGTISSVASSYLAALSAALRENNVNSIDNNPTILKEGVELDLYCGVDSSGTVLPGNFGAGAGQSVCTHFLAVNSAIDNAATGAKVVSAIRDHSSDLAAFSSETSQLPGNLAAEGQTLAAAANHAKTTGNASGVIDSSTVQSDAIDVQLYCGQDN